ncbi:MAG: hypothetical protein HY660_05155 [Armatimonadetes bacterium]|nr:hypothetical protein [Armatimonadota bacterium]
MKRLIGLLLLMTGVAGALVTSTAYAGEDLSGEDPPMAAAGSDRNAAGMTAGPLTPSGTDTGGAVNAGNKEYTGDRDRGGR